MSFLNNTGLATQINIIKAYVQSQINVATSVLNTSIAAMTPVAVGTVQAFAGSVVPEGWLLCDGSAISRTTYENLFSVIGVIYGAGDGETTFNLPDLTDKFIEGSATVGTEKTAGLPNITGALVPRAGATDSSVDIDFTGTGAIQATNATRQSGNTGTSNWNCWAGFNFDASRSSSIYGNSTTVQPPAVTMKYIIKY